MFFFLVTYMKIINFYEINTETCSRKRVNISLLQKTSFEKKKKSLTEIKYVVQATFLKLLEKKIYIHQNYKELNLGVDGICNTFHSSH